VIFSVCRFETGGGGIPAPMWFIIHQLNM